MSFFSKAILSGIFLSLMPICAYAENPEPAVPAPIQNMVAEGAQIRYLGHDAGLDGWVVLKNGQEQYFYATPDGQGIVMGVLFNSKGDTLTLRQINDLRKKEGPAIDKLAGYPDPAKAQIPSTTTPVPADFDNPQTLIKSVVKPKSEQLLEAAENANWIALGSDKAPIVYTFIDQSGYLEQGLIQLRLIPVGVLTENSLIEAAYLLASPTPEKDLYRHMDGEKGALLVDKSINTQGVQRNMKLMQDWNLDMTPFSIYRDRDNKIKVLQGRPSDIKKLITELR
jgi:hypothetical protein